MNQKLAPGAIALLGLLGFSSQIALAESGPMQTPLRVDMMYTTDTSDSIYVAFNPGSMPGCYNNEGGRLYPTNNFYDRLEGERTSDEAAINLNRPDFSGGSIL